MLQSKPVASAKALHVLVLWTVIAVTAACDGPADNVAPPQAGDLPATDPSLTLSIPYFTNRQRDERTAAGDVYTGDRGTAHTGRCEARFQPIEVLDELATRVPFYVPSESRKIVAAKPETPAVFWPRLEEAIAAGSTRSVVVFVHGYSNSFSRTCRMAAEMQRLLAGRATVLMFSWPSDGNPAKYVSDQADLEWSVPLLANTLQGLADRVGPSSIQLLAHSLGSRGVIQALQRMAAEGAPAPVIGRLVFLAPDYDAMSFIELLPILEPFTEGISLYASENDAPLRVSEELNGYPRLGQAGEHLTVIPGVETIDVTPGGRYQILGHEYFFYHPRVAADLVALLTTGAGAGDRVGLGEREHRSGATYWELEASQSDTPEKPTDFREPVR